MITQQILPAFLALLTPASLAGEATTSPPEGLPSVASAELVASSPGARTVSLPGDLYTSPPGDLYASPPGDRAGQVTEVRVASDGDETEITVRIEGEGEVKDFLLEDPARLVLDVEGAAHELPGHVFEGIGRGGVVELRTSQFRDGVVRLVFRLSDAADYEIDRQEGGVRVQFANPGDGFDAWTTTDAAPEGVAAAEASAAEAATRAGGGEPDVAQAAAADAEADAGDSEAGAGGAFESEQPRISVAYDEASLLDVISGFSEFSGLSIIPSSEAAEATIRGVEIHDQPWDVALEAILSSQGLGWHRMESGIIIVDDLASLRGRDTMRTETRVLRINYASADSVAGTLREMVSERGQVVPYQGTNSVIVTDNPSTVARMDSLVQTMDQRIRQVSIEAKIVFVDRTNVRNLGIVYDLKDIGSTQASFNEAIPLGGAQDPTTVDLGGESVAALANANDRLTNPALQILASVAFGNFALSSFIEALESHELSDIQAAPTIQVVDNHPARIQVGERTPIRVLEPQAQAQNAQVNVQFEDTGIILEVVPHITNNNQVLLDLMAERSGLQQSFADIGFVFEKQVGETRLLLEDGETGVIGGLTLSELTKSRSGIPGLMNLPVLGNLFQTSRETEVKRDLIILVTPHVVDSPGEAGALSM